jgi:hypothetical protein
MSRTPVFTVQKSRPAQIPRRRPTSPYRPDTRGASRRRAATVFFSPSVHQRINSPYRPCLPCRRRPPADGDNNCYAIPKRWLSLKLHIDRDPFERPLFSSRRVSDERKLEMRNLVQPPPFMHCELCRGELQFKSMERGHLGVDFEVQIFVCAKCGHEHSRELEHDRYAAHTVNAMPTGAVLPLNLSMKDKHPFSIKIEADPLNSQRSRWSICAGDHIVRRSPHSYATRREAEREASELMGRRIAAWQRDK